MGSTEQQTVREVFEDWLRAHGWKIIEEHGGRKQIAIDVWHPDGARLVAEVQETDPACAAGAGVDLVYGRLLSRMTQAPCIRYAVVVPESSVAAALAVPGWVRGALGLDIYSVDRAGRVHKVES